MLAISLVVGGALAPTNPLFAKSKRQKADQLNESQAQWLVISKEDAIKVLRGAEKSAIGRVFSSARLRTKDLASDRSTVKIAGETLKRYGFSIEQVGKSYELYRTVDGVKTAQKAIIIPGPVGLEADTEFVSLPASVLTPDQRTALESASVTLSSSPQPEQAYTYTVTFPGQASSMSDADLTNWLTDNLAQISNANYKFTVDASGRILLNGKPIKTSDGRDLMMADLVAHLKSNGSINFRIGMDGNGSPVINFQNGAFSSGPGASGVLTMEIPVRPDTSNGSPASGSGSSANPSYAVQVDANGRIIPVNYGNIQPIFLTGGGAGTTGSPSFIITGGNPGAGATNGVPGSNMIVIYAGQNPEQVLLSRLPAGAKIQEDGSILLPDGRILRIMGADGKPVANKAALLALLANGGNLQMVFNNDGTLGGFQVVTVGQTPGAGASGGNSQVVQPGHTGITTVSGAPSGVMISGGATQVPVEYTLWKSNGDAEPWARVYVNGKWERYALKKVDLGNNQFALEFTDSLGRVFQKRGDQWGQLVADANGTKNWVVFSGAQGASSLQPGVGNNPVTVIEATADALQGFEIRAMKIGKIGQPTIQGDLQFDGSNGLHPLPLNTVPDARIRSAVQSYVDNNKDLFGRP